MENRFRNLSGENLDREPLCCILRSPQEHPGLAQKKRWLRERLGEGHVYRKLDRRATVFIEYAPLEKAWVPAVGSGYMYIYCLNVSPDCRGRGYGSELMNYCLEDARDRGYEGVCMLGASRQKAWLGSQGFAARFGFEPLDTTDYGYTLLGVRFGQGQLPCFTEGAKRGTISRKALTVYYDHQCPFTWEYMEKLKARCMKEKVNASFVEVASLSMAKNLPCVFQNWAVFYQGRFETVNLMDETALERLINKKGRG